MKIVPHESFRLRSARPKTETFYQLIPTASHCQISHTLPLNMNGNLLQNVCSKNLFTLFFIWLLLVLHYFWYDLHLSLTALELEARGPLFSLPNLAQIHPNPLSLS